MVNITKVYTKTGDKGLTDLAAGKRISKASLRISAIGDLDELNAVMGWSNVIASREMVYPLSMQIQRIQQELFNLGAALAVLPEDRRVNTPIIYQNHIDCLEREIDEMNLTLPKLTSFILPGGGELSARLHVARTVCRRAERSMAVLMEQEVLDGIELPYLNRLSDWLFVAARHVATLLQEPEVLWLSAGGVG